MTLIKLSLTVTFLVTLIACSSVEEKVVDRYTSERFEAGKTERLKAEALRADSELDRNVNNLK